MLNLPEFAFVVKIKALRFLPKGRVWLFKPEYLNGYEKCLS